MYWKDCWGARKDRKNTFTCSFVSEDGTIEEGRTRNKYDLTGKMEVVLETPPIAGICALEAKGSSCE